MTSKSNKKRRIAKIFYCIFIGFLVFLKIFFDKLKTKDLLSSENSFLFIIFVDIYTPMRSPSRTLQTIIHPLILSHFS